MAESGVCASVRENLTASMPSELWYEFPDPPALFIAKTTGKLQAGEESAGKRISAVATIKNSIRCQSFRAWVDHDSAR
jgi:hypothetical protein